jgi:membrane protein
MPNLWTLGGLSWRELLWRTARESWEDEVFGQAARMAFYHLLAMFPALLLAVLLLIKLERAGSLLLETLDSSLRRVLPPGGSAIVSGFLDDLKSGSAAGEVGFAVVGWLWAAFNGTWAVISGLNTAYEVAERRSSWKITLITGALTLTLAALGFVTLALLFFGAPLGNMAGDIGRIFHWLVVGLLLLTAFSLLYRFGPDLEDAKMRWTTPGAVAAVALWISASLAFRAYAAYAASKYNIAYGSAANFVVLLLWFYVTNVAILIGGEINSEIENAAAQHGRPDARRPGERRPGGRPPPREMPEPAERK